MGLRGKQVLALAASLLCCNAFAQAGWCSPAGAFGLSFGDTVPFFSKRLEGGKASIWYRVKPPKPDPQFDLYIARVDAASAEIFEVQAHATVSPQYPDPPETFTKQQQAEGRASAEVLADKLLEQLPAVLRDQATPARYDAHQWQVKVDEDVVLLIGTAIPTDWTRWAWSASVSCKNLLREGAVAKRVMPELFNKSAK